MKQERGNNLFFLLCATGLALLFVLPWLMKDQLGIEHDTFFHLSRIEGMARSLQAGHFPPYVYPYKNNGFGYAAPLFYCDLFMVLPALLYLCGLPLSCCYQGFVFLVTAGTAFTAEKLAWRLGSERKTAVIAAAAYLFANYRITDAYVRSALGELTAMIFLPVLLSAMYLLLEKQDAKGETLLTLALCGLVFSHNLTFIMAAVLLLVFVALYRQGLPKEIWQAGFRSALKAFLLTAWFTLPMIEQLASQPFYLSYYAGGSDLAGNALNLSQYFVNRTVFGYSGLQYGPEMQMTVNPGWELMLLPLFWLSFRNPADHHVFIRRCLTAGLVCLILPVRYIPWDYLVFLRVLQFPWRLMTLAAVLLMVPLAVLLSALPGRCRSFLQYGLLAVILAEGCMHVLPVVDRPFTINSATAYTDITEGKLTDPYYSATYMRVELAGGDYIPIGSPDFRGFAPVIRDAAGNDAGISYARNDDGLTFTIKDEAGTYYLPVTWYKGYQVYKDNEPLAAEPGLYRLVSFEAAGPGTYTCRYSGTLLQKTSLALSLISTAVLILLKLRRCAV
ncbi:MAG: hypothetical protein IJH44_06235 [Solobacterium sp.]|nr:hypothetical protein [Solobacterium sp.]